MRLTVLGCSGSYPGRASACSGYLVQQGPTNLWIDAGPGSLANLQNHIGLDAVTAIVLTHEHPDHWSDVEGFFVARRYGESYGDGSANRPRLLVAPGITDRAYFDFEELFDITPIGDGAEAAIDGLRLRFSRTDHGPVTLAVRVDGDGRSLGYSADSGPAWSLEALGPGLDLALCEATFLKDREGSVQHLSGRQAGRTAKAAGVGRLMVTHVWPTIDPGLVAAEAAEAFGGPVELAANNESTEL